MTTAALCSMCESASASKVYGLPVCQRCFDGLVTTEATLVEMEAADPKLAELGRRVEETARRYLRERGA